MEKILIIEDTDDIRNYLVQLLSISGYDVIEAPNGLVGVQKIVENNPELVLCDIVMPELNGYEVLKTVRNNPHLATTPFIFLSSKSELNDFRTGMELGADDYLTKPVEPDHLLNSIRTRLNRTKQIEEEVQQKIKKIKTNLSSVYSHEVNTPLNGIIGLTDILIKYYRGSMKENMYEMLKHIKNASIRLHRTTSNLLKYADLQQYEGNNAELQYPKGSVNNYVQKLSESLEDLSERYRRKEDLKIDLVDCDLAVAEIDVNRVFFEAIDNALKFSIKGTPVYISSCIEGEYLKATVLDQGKGIRNEELNRIDSFVQFNRDTQEQQGLGLGLYIIKRLVVLNKGKLRIFSEENKGTQIEIHFPLLKFDNQE